MRTREEIKAYQRDWRERNAARLSEEGKAYRAAHAEKISAYQREYREKNADKSLEKTRLWRLAHGREAYARSVARKTDETIRRERRNQREWRVKNHNHKMWSASKARAARRGVEFTIAPEDIVVPTHCPIFGVELRVGRGPNNSIACCPTLDRIDPSRGYVRGNVWVISHRANAIKNDGTPEEHDRIAAVVRGKLAEIK
jgi:hypothetical protein